MDVDDPSVVDALIYESIKRHQVEMAALDMQIMDQIKDQHKHFLCYIDQRFDIKCFDGEQDKEAKVNGQESREPSKPGTETPGPGIT